MAADMLGGIEGLIIGGIVVVAISAGSIGSCIGYNNGKSDGLAEGIEKGKTHGREEATSNLVSAVESISDAAKKRLDDKFYSIVPETKNMSQKLLLHEISRGYESGINSLNILTKTIKNNAHRITTGELKAQDTEGYQFLIEEINTELKEEKYKGAQQ